jgi:hypothetical protein
MGDFLLPTVEEVGRGGVGSTGGVRQFIGEGASAIAGRKTGNGQGWRAGCERMMRTEDDEDDEGDRGRWSLRRQSRVEKNGGVTQMN